jgi:hypothetical protein
MIQMPSASHRGWGKRKGMFRWAPPVDRSVGGESSEAIESRTAKAFLGIVTHLGNYLTQDRGQFRAKFLRANGTWLIGSMPGDRLRSLP